MPYGRTTHHPFGVTNVFDYDSLGDYPAPDPSRIFQIFDDFTTYTSGTPWTLSEVGTGTDALTTGDFGQLLLTTTGASGDNECLQYLATTSMRTATAQGNKKMWFKTRLQVDDATLAAFTCGLYVTAASPITTPPTDGIRLLKAAATTSLSLVVTNGGVSTTVANVGTVANATFVDLAIFYDTNFPRVACFVNGTRTGSAVITNLPTSADLLRPSIAVQAGSAVARTMTIDYIFAAQERDRP
jgi:hypothetical protein